MMSSVDHLLHIKYEESFPEESGIWLKNFTCWNCEQKYILR